MLSFSQYLTEAVAPNKGDVFEFVFAAACVAYILNPGKVTIKQVSTIMDNYFQKKYAYKSGDKTVTLNTASLPEAALLALQNPKYRNSPEVDKIKESAIHSVTSASTILDDVGKMKGNIGVTPIGTVSQSGTKSDVDILVNNKVVKRISLKYGSKTFGQWAGTDVAVQIKEALANIGIKVTPQDLATLDPRTLKLVGIYTDRNDPNYTTHDKLKLFKAVQSIFDKIQSKRPNAQTIIDGFRAAVQGEEPDIIAISAAGKAVQIFDPNFFSKFEKGLKSSVLDWETESEGGNPSLVLRAHSKKDNKSYKLFKIRFRFDADPKKDGYKLRTRTYLEIYPEINKFISQF